MITTISSSRARKQYDNYGDDYIDDGDDKDDDNDDCDNKMMVKIKRVTIKTTTSEEHRWQQQ